MTNHIVCDDRVCSVNIDVVGAGANAKIVANPDVLEVRQRPVTIHFKLTADDYNFAVSLGRAIEFKDNQSAGRQFSRQGNSGPKRIVMNDKNTREPKNEYRYTIRVVDQNGGELELDPVIINGAR